MSKVEVNEIDKQSGSTLTIGGSGTTVQLGTGASQTGFGREGSVDWQTGSIKTTTFTAVSGEGYFVDTSSGAVTVNLPAGTAGAIVAFADYTRTFGNNALTITPNGSNKIGGQAASAELTVNGQSATFVFVDATEGWINVQETQTSQTGVPPFIEATGGTITTCGNDKIHTFTGPGTFAVSKIATCCAPVNNLVSYMVVAGGGAAAGIGANNSAMGGGGAGGFRELKSPSTPGYTASPLDGYPTSGNRITVTATNFPITVGAGGTGGSAGLGNMGTNGSASTFSTISSAGGGFGSGYASNWTPGSTGGSGGGGGYPNAAGMAGNTPPVTPPQGNPGGNGIANPGGCGSAGGGGAGGAGSNSTAPQNGGAGGIGAGTAIAPASGTSGPDGALKYFAGGGGGAPFQVPGTIAGGAGGGGGGAVYPPGGTGTNGSANTGGGAGGTSSNPSSHAGASGGSGIVVIRYRFQ